jgi:UDP-3-O-[3-hydroxymyristoyl] glucosamine N-acyltransferase
MSDRDAFFVANRTITASEIASMAGITLRTADFSISSGAALETAGCDDLSYMDHPKYLDALRRTQAGACLVSPRFSAFVPSDTISIVTSEPYMIYSRVLRLLYPDAEAPLSTFETTGVSAKATVHGTALVGIGVTIDPGAVIGPRARIGSHSCIGSNVVVGPDVTIGDRCSIGAGVKIAHAWIGQNVIIHPGASIGQDGFGYASSECGHAKMVQVGGVVVEADVEIGANTTVDRGSTRNTIIREGTKIDNLVQIAHNVVLGKHCLIAAQVGIAGSVTVGDFVAIGGQAGIAPHLVIGAGARVAGASGVTRDIPAGERWAGYPARASRKFFRQYKLLEQMADARTRTSR